MEDDNAMHNQDANGDRQRSDETSDNSGLGRKSTTPLTTGGSAVVMKER